MNAYNNAGFSGKSYEELRAVMPDAVDEKRIKKAIAQLIKERKLEYVDFRCYKVYPSYQSYLREFLHPYNQMLTYRTPEFPLCNDLKLSYV